MFSNENSLPQFPVTKSLIRKLLIALGDTAVLHEVNCIKPGYKDLQWVL